MMQMFGKLFVYFTKCGFSVHRWILTLDASVFFLQFLLSIFRLPVVFLVGWLAWCIACVFNFTGVVKVQDNNHGHLVDVVVVAVFVVVVLPDRP